MPLDLASRERMKSRVLVVQFQNHSQYHANGMYQTYELDMASRVQIVQVGWHRNAYTLVTDRIIDDLAIPTFR
jgi:hypothetical protein